MSEQKELSDCISYFRELGLRPTHKEIGEWYAGKREFPEALRLTILHQQLIIEEFEKIKVLTKVV